MKKKINLIILCTIFLLGICGCGYEEIQGNKEYYCESEEHELVGNKCIVKNIKDSRIRYYCTNGRTPYELTGIWYCGAYTLAEGELYCDSGYLEGIHCVVSETTYDAFVK